MIRSNSNKISALRHSAEIAIGNIFADENDKDNKSDKNDKFTDISEVLSKCRKVKYNVSAFYSDFVNINNILNSIYLYDNSLTKNLYDLINNDYTDLDIGKIRNGIFVCYSRIIKLSLDLKININVGFLATLFHELTHAYIDSSKKPDYSKYYNIIIEESLGEVMAYNCFMGTKYSSDAAKFIFNEDKPLSYKCGIYISEISKSIPLISIVNKWKNGNVKGILFYFYEFEKLSDDLYEILKQGPFFNRINVFYNIANRSDDYAANMLAMIIVTGTSNIVG